MIFSMFYFHKNPEHLLIESLIKNDTALLKIAVERGADVNGIWDGNVRILFSKLIDFKTSSVHTCKILFQF